MLCYDHHNFKTMFYLCFRELIERCPSVSYIPDWILSKRSVKDFEVMIICSHRERNLSNGLDIIFISR